MNSRIFSQLLLAGFIVLFSCTQTSKEKMPKQNLASLSFEGPTFEVTSTEIKSEASKPKDLNKIGINAQKLTEIAKTSKRIPMGEMLKTSVYFTENKGQLEKFENFSYPSIGNVKFYSKAFCGNAYFGNKGIGFAFQRLGFRDADFAVNGTPKETLSKAERNEVTGFSLQFVGANFDAVVEGKDQQHTRFNFLKGNNPSAFVTDVASYEQIRYKQLYKGVDLVYYSKSNQLKYDYVVAPKADISQIKMRYDQVNKLQLTSKGELEILINWGTLVDEKPYSFQIVNGKKKEVKVRYTLIDSMTVGFEVEGAYDPTKELVIDPYTVAWATYIGTATSDDGYVESTCMDNVGRTLATGWTNSFFPINASPNGYNKINSGGTEAFVFRLNVAGNALDYVTYLGGSANDVGTGIALNSAGEICVSGFTASYLQTTFVENTASTINMSVSPTLINIVNDGAYGFQEKLVLINGTNIIFGYVTFSSATQIYINTTSVIGSGTYSGWAIYRLNQLPFPTTPDAIQPLKTGNDGNDDIFFAKLNGAGNNLIYSTYYGGTASNSDWALDLSLDASGNAYMTGRTQTTTGFATAGVYKTAVQGGFDSFVLKINSNNTLGYCTYLGGAGNDIAKGIVASSTGEVYVAGLTTSTSQATVGAKDQTFSGGMDGFVLKLDATGNIVYYTYVGGTSDDGACGIDISNSTGEVVVVGTTVSADFPTMNAFDNSLNGRDAFLVRINATGSDWIYSTFLGGDGADNGKGWDFGTIHKNGGVKLSTGELPVVVYGNASSAASMASYLISPISYGSVNQAGVPYTYNGANFSGNDDWFINVFSANAQSCLFGMYMGGADNDYPTAGVNVDLTSACITVGGGVHSLPFPVTAGAFQTVRVNTTTPDQTTIAKICLTELLPVEFFYFDAIEQNGDGLLKWATASEKNNAYFEILKSTDGIHFYSIGKVDGNGTVNSLSEYSFVDTELGSGTTYYKLKQVDYDGNYRYSVVETISAKALSSISISPNPGNGIFEITSSLLVDGTVEVTVFSSISQIVYQSSESVANGTYVHPVNISDLASGVYVVQLKVGAELHTVRYVKE